MGNEDKNCKHREEQGIESFCIYHQQYLAGQTCEGCPEYEAKDEAKG
jgi:hypothetical protein